MQLGQKLKVYRILVAIIKGFTFLDFTHKFLAVLSSEDIKFLTYLIILY